MASEQLVRVQTQQKLRMRWYCVTPRFGGNFRKMKSTRDEGLESYPKSLYAKPGHDGLGGGSEMALYSFEGEIPDGAHL
ncbi:hypothetical protein V6N11_021194 [Hibiscus sabdariffa]|uniref:Uncharacterized protein n=1 Tax=Hibiscus sabdariffa TaxID=183260 RepID=A0ABR2NLQ7_9ROSI